MREFMKKLLNNSWMDKLKKGAQEPKNKTFRRSHVPFRLNFLFFIIFTLFVALIARLGYLQIVNGEAMEAKVKSSSTLTIQTSSPRGMIYDSTGKPLVTNQELIVVKQLPIIQEQLKQLSEEIDEKVANAKSLVCTEETVKEVKQVRADLNKEFKDLENQRKLVKEQVLEPYMQFEEVYKQYVSDKYKEADIELKNKVESVENELKSKTRTQAHTAPKLNT